MKDGTHPAYNVKITITCSCGKTFQTGSTEADMAVEVCSNCHPFYTGTQKLVDTAGRVDKFKKRLESKVEIQSRASRREKKNRKKETKLG